VKVLRGDWGNARGVVEKLGPHGFVFVKPDSMRNGAVGIDADDLAVL
jgi:hypothetical protein